MDQWNRKKNPQTVPYNYSQGRGEREGENRRRMEEGESWIKTHTLIKLKYRSQA